MKTRKGIYYFESWQAAEMFSYKNQLPNTVRLIPYDYGWAIQLKKGGRYYGPKGWA